MRLFAIQTLAVGLPLGSFLALKLNLMPAPWLGIPDAVLTAGVMVGLLSSGRTLFRLIFGLGASALALLAFNIWPTRAALAFPILFNLFLAQYFGQSLAGNQEPIISRIARLERGNLPDEVARYTRQLTRAWCIFFVVIAAELSVLALFATIETYMLFANTLNLIFVVAFFVIEYGYRRIRFPQYPQKPILHIARKLIDGGWLAKDAVGKDDPAHPES